MKLVGTIQTMQVESLVFVHITFYSEFSIERHPFWPAM